MKTNLYRNLFIRFFICIFMVNHEDTHARCKKLK